MQLCLQISIFCDQSPNTVARVTWHWARQQTAGNKGFLKKKTKVYHIKVNSDFKMFSDILMPILPLCVLVPHILLDEVMSIFVAVLLHVAGEIYFNIEQCNTAGSYSSVP